MIVRILALYSVLVLACSASAGKPPTEFSVAAYNVENLFDVDGVAIFDDYATDAPGEPFAYSRRKLLTKLENAADVLAALDPEGPDIVLLQELEGDFTPESGVTDFDAFLEQHAGRTVAGMLTTNWKPGYAGISAAAWLLKALEDAGMEGYHVVLAPTKPFDSGIAHVNAIFTRFPVREVRFHALDQARDLIEAELAVGERSLWVYNNHWKSGASDPEREPVRVRNARVLRALVGARLEADQGAELLIGGDLNSHYNHSLLYPEIRTGINDVLGPQYREGQGLYNLWYERPPPARYSEVWRGRRGTLMHLILSPGLYDETGISYLDGSFQVGRFRGLNADAMGRPLRWNFAGKQGGGASDHFPLLARFRTAPFQATGDLNRRNNALRYEMRHDADPAVMPADLPDGHFLNRDFNQDEGEIVGRLYTVKAKVLNERPLRLKVGDKTWPAYAPAPPVRRSLQQGMEAELVVSYGYWKGKPQLVVEAIRDSEE